MSINPGFHHFPAEAAIIGRLLAAFGELEVMTCYNTARATGLGDPVVAALYRIRAIGARLEAADALARPIYVALGLAAAYRDAFARTMYCRRIRNQFAHCNWGDNETAGLFFVDLQAAADRSDFAFHWKHIDAALLQTHELYFEGALEALRFADHEIAVKQGRLQSHWWPKPLALAQPPLHNPENLHIPPWLEPDEKSLHLARAQAAKGGAPTPTPAHLAMEAEREAARTRRRVYAAPLKRSDSEPEK